MSNAINHETGYSFGQIILATIAGIVGMAVFIYVWGKIFGITEPIAVAPPTVTTSKVDEAIKPVAQVEVAAAAGTTAEKSGEEVVKAVCAMCHGAGLMNAPKIGDKAQWAPRIAQGYETLVKNALNGIRSMPARGGNPALTDNEIASAVAHMANASGANFKAPTAKAAEAAPAEKAAEATQAEAKATESKPAEPKAAEAKPVEPAAKVAEAEAKPAAAAGKSGEEVYKAVCSMCHATGLMNAPKFGDKDQWGPRIAQGKDTLVNNALKGIRTMPAKGGNPSLSDEEVAAAVKHMANAAGAGF